MTTLVIAEHDNDHVKSATLNTVTAALDITRFSGGEVHVSIKDDAPAFELTPAAPKVAKPRPPKKAAPKAKKAQPEE